MDKKKVISIVSGIVSIALNLMAILYKMMLGMRAGWESMSILILIGFAFAIISVIIKRHAISWISLASTAAAVAVFFLFN